MNRRRFLETASVATAVSATAGVLTSCKDDAACTLKPGEILHTVAFSLKHGKESDATNAFLSDGKKISDIYPGCQKFPGIPPDQSQVHIRLRIFDGLYEPYGFRDVQQPSRSCFICKRKMGN